MTVHTLPQKPGEGALAEASGYSPSLKSVTAVTGLRKAFVSRFQLLRAPESLVERIIKLRGYGLSPQRIAAIVVRSTGIVEAVLRSEQFRLWRAMR